MDRLVKMNSNFNTYSHFLFSHSFTYVYSPHIYAHRHDSTKYSPHDHAMYPPRGAGARDEKTGAGSGGETKHLIEKHRVTSNVSDSENFVPVVFRWDHGGNRVHLVTDFVGWEYRNTMHRSGNDFSLIMNVPRDGKKHHYKFVVDGEWRTAAEQVRINIERDSPLFSSLLSSIEIW